MVIDYSSNVYLEKMDAWWRAANYISVGQIFLKDNPLLKGGLKATDVKNKPIGHWGTIPGANFIYAQLNRLICKYSLDMILVIGPGHAGPVMSTNSYLDGSYSKLYPEITQDEAGLKKLFKRFSFPGGIGSHAAPETPGSIHEGGELGYTISHAVGAILDNPNLISVAFIGDGEAETGPLMTSWLSNVFINPVNDGVVLPILHLNGAKISNPTILSRKSDEELNKLFEGFGWKPIFIDTKIEGNVHLQASQKFDEAIEIILNIKRKSRETNAEEATLPKWPMIIFRSEKGWTGPVEYKGKLIQGSFRSHQIPIEANSNASQEELQILERWLKSYRPEELFDNEGKFLLERYNISPEDDHKMSLSKYINNGDEYKLTVPDWKEFAQNIDVPGKNDAQDMIELGKFLSKVIIENPSTFRIFGPDETASNRLQHVFDVTDRQWLEPTNSMLDESISPVGRVIDSQLSEHQAQGFLEGYTLTGRNGIYTSYESFVRITDSMLTQHFKWLRKNKDISWRKSLNSLNVIATSYAFQQDHNGYTHQDPGVLTHLADKTPEFIREYLPSDTNTLLATMNKALTSKDKVNIIVASKHPRPQFYSPQEAEEIVSKGLKIIDWASTVSNNEEPDLVLAACGTEPNLECLATIKYLKEKYPLLKIRFVNVVDILKLRHPSVDKRGLSDEEFRDIFTDNKPIIFAFHAYEGLIRDIFYYRKNRNMFIHGYREEGAITTPFDMRVLNKMDRFHMIKEAVNVLNLEDYENVIREMEGKIEEHRLYIQSNGDDLPEIKKWRWGK